jgi:hypothetical protein
MLVSDFVHIDRPFARVRQELAAAGPAWLADSAVAAYTESEQLSLRVLAPVGPVRLSKRVWAELGEPVVRADRVSQPLSWRASGATGLFPSMEAEIDIAPMGDAVTAISFHGSYVPPLGPLGRSADRMLLHRLAEATVRALLDRVARRLQEDGAPARLAVDAPRAVAGA